MLDLSTYKEWSIDKDIRFCLVGVADLLSNEKTLISYQLAGEIAVIIKSKGQVTLFMCLWLKDEI